MDKEGNKSEGMLCLYQKDGRRVGAYVSSFAVFFAVFYFNSINLDQVKMLYPPKHFKRLKVKKNSPVQHAIFYSLDRDCSN